MTIIEFCHKYPEFVIFILVVILALRRLHPGELVALVLRPAHGRTGVQAQGEIRRKMVLFHERRTQWAPMN